MAVGKASMLTAVRFEAINREGLQTRNPTSNPVPRLSLTKPSWVVRTESNIPKEEKKKPDPPCVICKGSGRVDCYQCHGKGRTNCDHLVMLPKGEWPKWCRVCGGSGLSYCSRCIGTGEYRHIMGFQFMKRDTYDTQDTKSNLVRNNSGPRSAIDFLFNEETNSEHET